MQEVKLQWHSAFTSALRIELEENMDNLLIEEEHLLGKKPMQIDVLIVKKDVGIRIRKNIGRIFRKHNIIEYKSPEDYLSINDFYNVFGYACRYQADTDKVMEIDPEEITITFVAHSYPGKMLEHLKKVWHMHIVKKEGGIYYLTGAAFPIQLVVTKELSDTNNFWLKSIRNDYKEKEEFMELLDRYEMKKESVYYQAVMDIILRANRKVIEEERKVMCDALRELYEEWVADELEMKRKAAVAEGLQQGIKQGIEQGIEQGAELSLLELIAKKLKKHKSPEQIAEDLEEDVSVIERICNVMKDFAPEYDTISIYKHMQKM